MFVNWSYCPYKNQCKTDYFIPGRQELQYFVDKFMTENQWKPFTLTQNSNFNTPSAYHIYLSQECLCYSSITSIFSILHSVYNDTHNTKEQLSFFTSLPRDKWKPHLPATIFCPPNSAPLALGRGNAVLRDTGKKKKVWEEMMEKQQWRRERGKKDENQCNHVFQIILYAMITHLPHTGLHREVPRPDASNNS